MESIRIALEGLASNRLRSALTMLGVIFGVGAVIAAVSMTEGAKAATLEQFQAFGTNVLTLRPGQWRRGPVRGGMGSIQTLTEKDAKALVEQCPTVVSTVPQVRTNAQVEAGSENTNTSIIGTTASFAKVENYKLAEGRFFGEEDVQQRRKVAVLGPTVVENLFGAGAHTAGQRLRIAGVTFDAIGVFKQKGDIPGPWSPDDQIVVPITTARQRLGAGPNAPGAPPDAVSSITVECPSMELVGRGRMEVQAVLRHRHGIAAGEEDDFSIMAAADMIEGAQQASRIMTLLFGSIAAVSLLVGGIGIMNIMLVSVTERTREIGLRKAVGATPRDILLQFLIESVTLSSLGGLLGVSFGIGLAYALHLVGLNTVVSVPWIIISFLFAGFVGVFFGLLPSRKAALLNPIEALRYE